jgi:FkbM family methyltransferase
MSPFYDLYVAIFARRRFRRLNRALFMMGARGLGVLNYKGSSSDETWFVRKYLATDKKIVVFDVGANIGDYAREVLAVSGNAKIYAFEPHPRTYVELAKVAGIQSFNVAFGDRESVLELFDYAGVADGSQHASIFRDVIEGIHKGKSTSHLVSCTRVDDFCEQHNIDSIDLLKIDTEGNELSVLRGAKKLIDAGKIRLIQFEFNEMNVISRSYMRDFVELLSGYHLYRLLPSGLLPLKYSPLSGELFAFQNIIAVSRSSTLLVDN